MTVETKTADFVISRVFEIAPTGNVGARHGASPSPSSLAARAMSKLPVAVNSSPAEFDRSARSGKSLKRNWRLAPVEQRRPR